MREEIDEGNLCEFEWQVWSVSGGIFRCITVCVWWVCGSRSPALSLTSPTFAADGPYHHVWWRNLSGRTFWPGPPLFCNTDLFVFFPQQASSPLHFGHLGEATGVIASLTWQEEKAVFSNSIDTQTHSPCQPSEVRGTSVCIIIGHYTQHKSNQHTSSAKVAVCKCILSIAKENYTLKKLQQCFRVIKFIKKVCFIRNI